MFGNKDKLIQELTEQGASVAWATVVKAREEWQSSTSTPRSYNVTDHVKVTVSVEPDGEPPFDATFHQAFPRTVPMNGWRCKVIYDPADHDRIAVLADQIFPPGMDPAQAERAAAMRAAMTEAVKSGNMAAYIEQIKAQAAAGAFPGALVVGGNTVPGASPPATDAVDQLTKLADLHDRGALTDAEFSSMKAKILGTE
jgi:hypothetical protein